MSDASGVIKKLQLKDQSKPILVINAPKEYELIMDAFESEVHTVTKEDSYSFIQVFGVTNEDLKKSAKESVKFLQEDGLYWLCYPKKSSKKYKGSDCSRDIVATFLGDEGFEPVRQVAIDEDWSALRFRKIEHIKTMKRQKAWTEKGQKRVEGNRNNK